MFTLVKNRKYLRTVFFIYLGITAFIAIFGGIYEQFSHDVMSKHMIYAYHWVFGFGALVYLFMWLMPFKKMPGVITECVYNTGVAMITMRSIYMGVVEIYGKSGNRMTLAYTVMTIIFLSIGAALLILCHLLPIKETKK